MSSHHEDARIALFVEYEAAIVSTLDPVHGWVDPALACVERDEAAVVLTAWNPGFDRPGEAANRQRNAELSARLEATGLEVWRADGRDPQAGFSEEGFLVWGMAASLACRVGREFGQFAIYAYDRQGVRTVVPCAGPDAG